MGNRGRYGKYGERKRLERLRDSRKVFMTSKGRDIEPKEGASFFSKKMHVSPLRIRPARPMDVDYIRDLSKRSFLQYGPYDNVLSEWFELGTTLTLLAGEGKRDVGFAMLSQPLQNYPIPLEIEVLAIAVERNRWRKGIGDILMGQVEIAALQLKVDKVLLHTAVENLPARSLFEKHGFVPAEIKRGFYPRGQDALMMIKEI
jgi:ribosomal protein S18 acetylase RimI-like enzyme